LFISAPDSLGGERQDSFPVGIQADGRDANVARLRGDGDRSHGSRVPDIRAYS
jgi:hypothetical protein